MTAHSFSTSPDQIGSCFLYIRAEESFCFQGVHLKTTLLWTQAFKGAALVHLKVIMADSTSSSMTTLAKALSFPRLELDKLTGSPAVRTALTHPGRRRKLSSVVSSDKLDVVPSLFADEARVLVINTGGTIGMVLHDNGNYDELNSLERHSPVLCSPAAVAWKLVQQVACC